MDWAARCLSDQSSFSKQVNFGKDFLKFVYGVFGIIFSTFWAEDHGFLENPKKERCTSGYKQDAKHQQSSPVTHDEAAPSAQGRKLPAVIQGSSNSLCPRKLQLLHSCQEESEKPP